MIRQHWRTPPDLFQALHRVFNFSIDAAAAWNNTLLPRYWSEQNDALKQSWWGERVYCNPPFGKPAHFLLKAHTAKVAVVLLPTSALTANYFTLFGPPTIAIPHGRISFRPPAGSTLKHGSPACGVVLCLYRASKRQCQRLERAVSCSIAHVQ